MATTASVDMTERIGEFSKAVHKKFHEPNFLKMTDEAPKIAFKGLKGPNFDDLGSFTLASFCDSPKEAIVFHEDFLGFPSTYPIGMPGIFRSPVEHKSTPPSKEKKSPYDLTVEDIPLSAHQVIRYIVNPASASTVIHTDLRNAPESINTHETIYYLQSGNGNACAVPGYRTDVKLDLVFWDFERYTRASGIYGSGARSFPIDSAVLLDPHCPDKSRQSETPVCLLGMDFLTKYPYLMFIPKLGPRDEMDFTLAGNPLVYRPYRTFTKVSKELVIHIAARYDAETGRIGCGVFFKSGSILNLFSGVSRYGKDGNKHMEYLWERGVLVGVIKALHVVASFPAGHGFTDVIIRTESLSMNQLLTQMQNYKDEIYRDMKGSGGDPLDDGFLCPSPHRDLVMYIHRQFLRNGLGIKIHFEGFSTNGNYDAMEAAGVLAAGGAEMKEFCLKSSVQKNGQKDTKDQHITLLETDSEFWEKDLYVNLGIDGHFYIPSKRALDVMKSADKKACLSWSKEDAVYKLGYPAWEGEVAAGPNGFPDMKNYEFHKFSLASNFETLGGILGENALTSLNHCLENPKWTPEDILEIIKSSTRKIKVHEYLALQKKEYRDGYLKELERKGLEKGWHFCKDKFWTGYLRRNTKIYDRKRWFRVQSEKQTIEDAFNLGNDKQGLGEKKVTRKSLQTEENSKPTIKADPINIMGDCALKDAFSTGYSEDSNYSDYTSESECLLDTKELAEKISMNSEESIYSDTDDSLGNFNAVRAAQTGIGTRVAARHRSGKVGNIMVIDIDESDSTYKIENAEDSKNHSSEYWLDSEKYTDVEDLMGKPGYDRSLSTEPKKKHPGAKAEVATRLGYKAESNSTVKTMGLGLEIGKDKGYHKAKETNNTSYYHRRSIPQEPEGFTGYWQSYLTGNDEISAESSQEEFLCTYKHQRYSNAKRAGLNTSPWIPHDEHEVGLRQIERLNASNSSIPRDCGTLRRGVDAGGKGMERKWPPFEWALENEFLKRASKPALRFKRG